MTKYIELRPDRMTVGPFVLRALVDGARIIQTELLLAGREWPTDRLLDHERAWYNEAVARLPEVAAQFAAGGAA